MFIVFYVRRKKNAIRSLLWFVTTADIFAFATPAHTLTYDFACIYEDLYICVCVGLWFDRNVTGTMFVMYSESGRLNYMDKCDDNRIKNYFHHILFECK